MYLLLMSGLASGLWPIPKKMQAEGKHSSLCKAIQIDSSFRSALLESAIERTRLHFQRLPRDVLQANDCLGQISITVHSTDETLSMDTDYSYSVTVSGSTAVPGGVSISAASSYGAMYGLETLLQLAANGEIQEVMVIEDSPDYVWRGLLVDTGRRFFPVPLLKELMDTMAAVKMNVSSCHHYVLILLNAGNFHLSAGCGVSTSYTSVMISVMPPTLVTAGRCCIYMHQTCAGSESIVRATRTSPPRSWGSWQGPTATAISRTSLITQTPVAFGWYRSLTSPATVAALSQLRTKALCSATTCRLARSCMMTRRTRRSFCCTLYYRRCQRCSQTKSCTLDAMRPR